jgi:hypothetical protein
MLPTNSVVKTPGIDFVKPSLNMGMKLIMSFGTVFSALSGIINRDITIIEDISTITNFNPIT